MEEKAEDVDWSAPTKTEEDELELKWSDDEKEDKDEEDGVKPMEISVTKPEENKISEPLAEVRRQLNELFLQNESSQVVDIIAQHLKFVASMRIMTEELSTLASGFEVDGGQLRYQLFHWLEKEVDVLKVRFPQN